MYNNPFKEKKSTAHSYFIKTVTTTAIVLLVFAWALDIKLSVDYPNDSHAEYIFAIILFTLSISFLIISVAMCVLLKDHFPEYYEEHKCLLICASIGLSFPIFIYSLCDMYRHFFWDDSILVGNVNQTIWDCFSIPLCFILPMCF